MSKVLMTFIENSRFTFRVNGVKIAGKWDSSAVIAWTQLECMDRHSRFFISAENLSVITYSVQDYREILRELIRGDLTHSGPTLPLIPGLVP